MIIKRWDTSGTPAFVEVYPKTIHTMLYASDGTTTLFDSGKLKPAYLPDSVFDSLYYFAAISANTTLRALASAAYLDATSRKAKGYYWVVTAAATLTANATEELVGSFYWITSFIAGEGAPTTTVTLEPGDWIIFDAVVSGDGATGTPFVVRFATVNNTYETATTGTKGIVKISDAATYASLDNGADVINEDVAYSLLADKSHSHGNLSSAGTFGGNAAAVTGGSIVITDASGAINRGNFNFDTGVTTTFLNKAGAWADPHPNHSGDVTSAGAGATTIAANAVTYAKMQQVPGFTILGKASTGTGAIASITSAASAMYTLRMSDTGTLGFGTLGTAALDDAAVTFAKIQHSASDGLSVIGRSATGEGDFAEIAAGTNNYVLRRSGSALGFGLIVANNVTAGTLTNSKLYPMAQNTIKGRITASSGDPEDLTAANVRTITETWPMYCQTATPTTTISNAVWLDIN